jgi:hypothetical protein
MTFFIIPSQGLLEQQLQSDHPEFNRHANFSRSQEIHQNK